MESTYEITGKSKRGDLGNVKYGDDGYELTYLLRSSKKKVKMEHYTFNSDFRFQNMEEEELELSKAKGTYSWVKGEEEGASKQLLRVENNLTGQVVLKRGNFVQKCDYYNGYCWWDFDVEDRTRPKDPEGRRLTLLAFKTDEPQTMISYRGWSWLSQGKTKSFSNASGDVTLICSVLPKIKDAKAGVNLQPYAAMRVGVNDETIKKELYFGDEEFKERPQTLAFQQVLDNGNIGLLFAPTGGPGMKKVQDPDPLNWRYIEINPDEVTIAKNVQFKSLNSYWKVSAIVTVGDDVYIYGPADDKKNDKYYNTQTAAKFSKFCVARISNGQMAMINNTSLDEFKGKMKSPPSQKKGVEYAGKKFVIGEFIVTKSGDMIIGGQNYKPKEEGPEFKDVFAFHFNDKGELKAQYGVDIEETNKTAKSMATTGLFRETQDGKSVVWIILEVAGAQTRGGETRALMYPRVAKIDLATSELSDFTTLGYGKKEKYYLANDFPILPTTVGGDKLTFFGSDKSGKNIWFCRVNL